MKFLLSHLSLLPLSPWRVMKLAKKTGWDGVEILFAGSVRKSYMDLCHVAESMGLTLHFHEAWSNEESSTPSLLFQMLEKVGYLPSLSAPFLERVPLLSDCPVVVYANHVSEHGLQANHWVQTACMMMKGKHAISWPDFRTQYKGQPVVFDPFHFLEMVFDGRQTYSLSGEDIWTTLDVAMDLFGQNVQEVHLQDWGRKLGRACQLDQGEIPFREFAQALRKKGFDGAVTPEVHPKHFLFGREAKVRAMLETAKSIFGQWS